MALKIYRMNDVTEWVAANTLQEAIKFYIDFCVMVCGMFLNEVDYENAVEEEKIDSLKYVDENDSGTGVAIMTFREQLEKNGGAKPYFFASTEY